METPSFSIAAVERDTGLSKDVLRRWEQRYGFPVPLRDENGDRLYPGDQVQRLLLIRRLMEHGHRPGKLVRASLEELHALAASHKAATGNLAAQEGSLLADLLFQIRDHDAVGYQQAMQQWLARCGMREFVQNIVAPLAHYVGQAWEDGDIQVYEEHLFTELTKRLLRQAIMALPPGTRGPKLVLTTVPGEQHGLGLLMAEAVMAPEGVDCVPLGTEMPLIDIARAAEAHGADILALSFSLAFPRRHIGGLLEQLRHMLPGRTEMWVGGEGVRRLAPNAGYHIIRSLPELLAAVEEWRGRHGR